MNAFSIAQTQLSTLSFAIKSDYGFSAESQFRFDIRDRYNDLLTDTDTDTDTFTSTDTEMYIRYTLCVAIFIWLSIWISIRIHIRIRFLFYA